MSSSTVTYTSISSDYEEPSDAGSPGVIVYKYDRLPMHPVDPYVEAVLQAPEQAPPSLDYVPGPEHPPSPDYVPDPEDPEQAPAFSRLSSTNMLTPTSPITGNYVADIRFKSQMINDNDDDDETDDDDVEEDRRSTSSADSLLYHYATAPTPLITTTIFYFTPLSSPSPKFPHHPYALPSPHLLLALHMSEHIGYKAPRLVYEAASSSTHHPSEIPSPPLLLPSTKHIDNLPEADMPLRKIARFTAPTGRFEVRESSLAAGCLVGWTYSTPIQFTSLDDGVAASFQRSRIHKPHAHTQAFKVNRSTSGLLILNFPTIKEPQTQVDQESQIKMIQVKEMMQDNDLKNSKSKDKGSRSRSQSMNEQSHYKQDKTKTRQSINVKSHIFNVIGSTEEFEERDLNIGGDC
ncbi:hypothetical protein Tco_0411087 [Tanacetum coccineum]